MRELWRNYKILDVNGLIVLPDKKTLIGWDGRYESLIVFQVVPGELPGEEEWKAYEPDGEEREIWLLELGLVTEEQAEEIAARLTKKENRRRLYETLAAEFETPDSRQLIDQVVDRRKQARAFQAREIPEGAKEVDLTPDSVGDNNDP